jgi:hypothetical protein
VDVCDSATTMDVAYEDKEVFAVCELMDVQTSSADLLQAVDVQTSSGDLIAAVDEGTATDDLSSAMDHFKDSGTSTSDLVSGLHVETNTMVHSSCDAAVQVFGGRDATDVDAMSTADGGSTMNSLVETIESGSQVAAEMRDNFNDVDGEPMIRQTLNGQ